MPSPCHLQLTGPSPSATPSGAELTQHRAAHELTAPPRWGCTFTIPQGNLLSTTNKRGLNENNQAKA